VGGSARWGNWAIPHGGRHNAQRRWETLQAGAAFVTKPLSLSAVAEGQVIGDFACHSELSPIDRTSRFFPWRRPTYHEGYVRHSSL